MKVLIRLYAIVVLFCLSATFLAGESVPPGGGAGDGAGSGANVRSLKDHLATRKATVSSLLSGKSAGALAFKDAVDKSGSEPTQIFVTPGQETFTVTFAAKARGGPRSSGDYIVKRNTKTGYLMEIEVVLSDDGASFVRLRSLDAYRTALDLYSGGEKVKAGVTLGSPLYYFLVKSFSEVVDLAGSRVTWP
ncbi:MAG: hypothetical protein Q8M76_17085 [Spirochaetaceae bacterium]|nr:hypothetical protein [Spirochaetaceae bacterium]